MGDVLAWLPLRRLVPRARRIRLGNDNTVRNQQVTSSSLVAGSSPLKHL